jgi:hypothetical protein
MAICSPRLVTLLVKTVATACTAPDELLEDEELLLELEELLLEELEDELL